MLFRVGWLSPSACKDTTENFLYKFLQKIYKCSSSALKNSTQVPVLAQGEVVGKWCLRNAWWHQLIWQLPMSARMLGAFWGSCGLMKRWGMSNKFWVEVIELTEKISTQNLARKFFFRSQIGLALPILARPAGHFQGPQTSLAHPGAVFSLQPQPSPIF